MKKKALVLGGSSGIGKAIADALKSIGVTVVATSREDVDTADLESVKRFADRERSTDILVLNTGGPPKRDFFDITEEEWLRYHNQLFLGFCVLLKRLTIKKGGYIFLLSSHLIHEPNDTLALSFSYRLAFWSVLKSLSKRYAAENISSIAIAPGPIKTERLKELRSDLEDFEKTLPFKRVGAPKEIGDLVASIVEHEIKYLSGTVITIDGGMSRGIF